MPVFLAVLSAACNATGDARPAAAAALCTRHHGFDPAAPDLPARGLATGELAWGACMRGELAARPTGDVALDEAREELLALHRRLTAEVAAGELGRDEARSRLREAIAAARA